MSATAQAQPGLRDIARQLSLSVWTVSKALNGQPGVKASTRRRVVETAQSVGYVPNRQAQILRQKRSRCIGLLLPTLVNPIYSERVRDIYEAAEERGYEVMVTSYEQSSDRRARICRELIGRRVEAVILSGLTRNLPLLRDFIDAGIHVLIINPMEPRTPNMACLQVDWAEGVRRLSEYTLKLGHRRPLLLGHWDQRRERLQGVRQALRRAGCPEDDFEVAGNEISQVRLMEEAYDQVRDLFAQNPRHATLIMASNDLMAIGAMTALKDLRLSIPNDVSVTGIDNITAAQYCRPALTTISQTHLELGRHATEMILDILDEKAPRDFCKKLTPELVIRSSTGPAGQTLC